MTPSTQSNSAEITQTAEIGEPRPENDAAKPPGDKIIIHIAESDRSNAVEDNDDFSIDQNFRKAPEDRLESEEVEDNSGEGFEPEWE